MSVSGLVAKSVTGMVTFGSSGSGVQFTMEEVTLDLVMVNNLVKEAMDCLIASNSGEEMRRRELLAVTTCLVSLL